MSIDNKQQFYKNIVIRKRVLYNRGTKGSHG